jgi:hypothetical protein
LRDRISGDAGDLRNGLLKPMLQATTRHGSIKKEEELFGQSIYAAANNTGKLQASSGIQDWARAIRHSGDFPRIEATAICKASIASNGFLCHKKFFEPFTAVKIERTV